MSKAMKWHAQDLGTVSEFLSADECNHYVTLSESQGYQDAPVSTPDGMIIMKDVRNNERVMIDDSALAASLYERIKTYVPTRFKKKWEPVGVNERLRFYRYDVGQQFDWHMDGYFERDNGERSFFTFMVYLNDDFEGGGTSFSDFSSPKRVYEGIRVVPRKGMALLFHHPIMHRGDPVTAGRKYVLRSDIMFRRRAAD